MQVHANIDEADIGQVQLGETATFTVDAFRGEKFRARVSQIRNAPQTVQNVVTYDVVMDVDNPDLKLRPGMTANVRIVSANKKDILLIPNPALRFKPPVTDGKVGAPVVQKRDEGAGVYLPDTGPNGVETAKRVKVEIGLTDGSYTEIVNGLSEGQDVIVDLARDKSGPAPAPRPQGFGRGF